MKFYSLGLLLIVIALSGCGATGPKYSEHQSTVADVNENSSRVFFFRNSRFMSGGADAEIFINDIKAGEVADSAYFFVDVPPGKVSIKAENSLTPGSHLIEAWLEKGKEYFYEVLINEAYVSSAAFLGFIGQSAYVAANENVSGWFFKATSEEDAIPQLEDKVFSLDGE